MTKVTAEAFLPGGYQITKDTLLGSIREKEKWWEQLEQIITSERGGQVSDFLNRAIGVFNNLQEAAQHPQIGMPQAPEQAARIKAIWVKSAHGTYFQGEKEDRFKGKKWALWNDRQRINYGLGIARSLAELTSGQRLTGNWAEDSRIMMEHGPLIIYAGRWDENAAISEAARLPWLRLPNNRMYPTEKFFIINAPKIDNSADVIRNFRMPSTYHLEIGNEIGVVTHVPQGVRFLFMLNQIENKFPNQAMARMYPMQTPQGGIPEYLLQELRGLTFYRFISDPPLAADTPHPYIV